VQNADEVGIISADNLAAFYQFVNKRTANRSCIGVIVEDSGS